MTRLRTVTVLLLVGLVLALAGSTFAASPTGTSAPYAQDSDDNRHCC